MHKPFVFRNIDNINNYEIIIILDIIYKYKTFSYEKY